MCLCVCVYMYIYISRNEGEVRRDCRVPRDPGTLARSLSLSLSRSLSLSLSLSLARARSHTLSLSLSLSLSLYIYVYIYIYIYINKYKYKYKDIKIYVSQDPRIVEAARAETGLRVMALPFDREQLTGYEPFLTCLIFDQFYILTSMQFASWPSPSTASSSQVVSPALPLAMYIYINKYIYI